MNLNLNHLRSFLLVAEQGNLTRAAERRHSTPSAVSAHLQQLEQRLRVRLFTRTRQGMELTASGEHLLPSARRVLAALRDLTDAADELNGQRSRNVRVGLNAPPEHLQVGPLMAACARGDPPLVVQLESSMSERIIEDVIAGRLDAGFVYGAVEDRALAHDPVAMRRLRIAAPGDFALERLPEDRAERAALPWIWPGVSGCPFRKLMPAILGAWQAEANVVTYADGEESARALVRAGMGLGLLEERYAREGAGDRRLKILADGWDIELGLVYRADRADDAVIVALRDALALAWSADDEPVPA